MLVQVGDDINSDIGTLPGQTNRGYQSKLPSEYFAGNKIMDGHHITVPRDERKPGLGNNAYAQKYSDELANGDAADDREIHEEEDVNDHVVDYNGHTNRGYGSTLPKDYFDRNHIMPGHHITVPRDEANKGLGNNAHAQIQQRSALMQDDINSNIGTLPGQTNTNYQSMLPVDYFAQNKIFPGHHITIPKDEYRVTMGNNAHAQLGDDINSNIGTLPGQTNTNYQSMLPVDYFKQNKIFPGHHITTPKDEYRVTLGNNAH
jgi:hypothetical protein